MILRGENSHKIKKWSDLSGVIWEHNEGKKVTWDNQTAAQILTRAVGKETVRNLHKGSKILDIGLVLLAFSLFIGIGLFLAFTPFKWYTIGLWLVQGTVIINLFYALRHDVFMHRQLGGSKVAYFFGVLLSLPMMNTYTRFLLHADHHFHVGYDLFEEHIAELDKKWKRWLGLTMLGFVLMFSGKLKSPDQIKYSEKWKEPPLFRKAKTVEQTILWIWVIALIAATVFWPYALIMGYWIPFVFVVPFLAGIKNSLQHAECNPENPLHAASFFKSNWFITVFFCCSTGELHLVHHIFPHIPFYKTPKAAKIFRPILREQGVPERRLTETLWGYYIVGKPYREPWTV